MKQVTQKTQKQLHIWLLMLLTFTPIVLMGQLMGVKISAFNLIILIAIIYIVIWTAFKNPMFYFVVCLLAGGGLYGLFSWQHPWYNLINNYWWSFRINFGNYLAGYDLLTPSNSLIALVLVGGLLVVLTRLILTKYNLHFIYFLSSLTYLIYGWYLHIDVTYYLIMLHCVIYLFFYTVKAYSRQSKLSKTIAYRGTESLFGKWLITSSRYLILILLGAILLPAFKPLIVWHQVEMVLTERYPALKELRQDIEENRTFSSAELFNLSQTGYSDESGQLGGPVILNDDVALEVLSPYPLYLRGNILTTYDGRKWDYGKRFKVEKETDRQLLREVKTGEEIEITITHKGMSSFTLFTPYQVNSVSINRPGKIWIDINQQITLIGARYVGEHYTLSAILPEDSSNATQGSAAILFNREDYLQLPESLPPRVKEFAQIHSADGETAYDKAHLLTTYLRTHYDYSLSPDYLAVGQDFVDNFLFEEKQGYCTYFATSLSILLRTLDIPTRYVEGFRTPDQSIDGRYQVALSHGHAWVEAYFDGYGWITLEATPAYQPPTAPLDTQLLIAQESVDLYSLEDEKAYLIAMRDSNLDDTDVEVPNNNGPSDKFPLWQSVLNLLPTLIFIGLIGLLPIRYFYLKRQYQHYKKRKASPEKLIHLYHNITELFTHGGYPRGTGETTSEYAHRVKKQFYDDKHDFELLTAYYLEIKYGHVPNFEIGIEKTENYLDFVEQRLKHKLGPINYYGLKYVSGQLYTRHESELVKKISSKKE